MRFYEALETESDCGKYGVVRFYNWLHPSETRKSFTEQSIASWATLVGTDEVAIDIGAHTGDTSVPMSLVCQRVLAFEPNPFVFHVLSRNASIHKNIIPLPFAVTPEDGQFDFSYCDDGFCNGGLGTIPNHVSELRVTGLRLNHFIPKLTGDIRIGLIKIDTEGQDFPVLRSIESIILDHRPNVMLEVFRYQDITSRSLLLAYLAQLGYEFRKEIPNGGSVLDRGWNGNLVCWHPLAK